MLTASIVLFLYAALSGLVMAVGIFRGAKPWVPLALGHGALAATARVLALLVATATGIAAIKYGVAVLVLAALGGFYLLSFHLRGKPHGWSWCCMHSSPSVGSGVSCSPVALMSTSVFVTQKCDVDGATLASLEEVRVRQDT